MPKRAEARKLRDQGLGYEVIGFRLGVSTATAWRWADPAHEARSRQGCLDYKDRNREYIRAQNRAYRATHKGECPSCGGEMQPQSKRCAACRNDESDRKARTVVRLWAEGKSGPEIQGVMGWSKGHFGMMMDRLRGQGYDLPYRYNGKVYGHKFPEMQKASDRIRHNSR